MRRIIIFITVFFLFIVKSFAFNWSFDVSSEEVLPWETFSVNITIEGTWSIDISSLSITWIENFSLRGKSEQSSIQIVNGVSNITKQYSIILEPQMVGDFELGPVFLWEDEEVFIDKVLPIKVGTGKEEVQKDFWTEIISATGGKDGNGLNDIKELKSENENKNIIFFLLFFLIFLIIFYYLLKSFFIFWEKKEQGWKEKEKESEGKKRDFESEIKQLKRRQAHLSREDFYETFHILLCDYFEEKYKIIWVWAMTYEEIKKKKNIFGDEFLSLFKEVYFTLFDEKREDESEKRKSLLDDFLENIKK